MSYITGKVKMRFTFIYTVALPFLIGMLIPFLKYEGIEYNVADIITHCPAYFQVKSHLLMEYYSCWD